MIILIVECFSPHLVRLRLAPHITEVGEARELHILVVERCIAIDPGEDLIESY